ncbi:MAG: glycoside hydrolase family 97 protein [Dysgonamonadaceae bacterium]|jgi:alpha-glucosidase|nr:glycoside hydrolase family 97 protein [Dysgonamonadaceae bacterium]
MKKIFQIQFVLTSFITLFFAVNINAQKSVDYSVKSPNGKIELAVFCGTDVKWSINSGDAKVITPSAISLSLGNGKILGQNSSVSKVTRKSVDTSFETLFYKKKQVKDHYNLLLLQFKDNYSIEFRVYDDGAAYRFLTDIKGEITVRNEEANFNFSADYTAFIPYVNDNRGGERYSFSFESFYDESKLSEMFNDSLSIVPFLVDLGKGKKAALLESDVEDYPCMFLKINEKNRNGLVAEFAPYLLEGKTSGINFIAGKRADYIAKTSGKRTFPWRAVVISDDDAALADNDMTQKLAAPSRISDISWIKPGKAAWDWWNNANLTHVDFKAGMNTATFKYFIDFASANHIEYVVIDAGWSFGSLMQVNPAINLIELVDYAKNKNVDLILWSGWNSTDKEKEKAFPHYAAMGIKGFKVDFFDNDDQVMMKSAYDIARVAAENKLILDLHGFKPTGIQRTYPNVVNFEGVKGLENYRWAAFENGKIKQDAMRYDVTIPFIRMLSGPMDYTPGAMSNGTGTTYRTIDAAPMSQGTRVHQMAMYTIFEAPLQMLADSPSSYIKEQECTDFIAKIPVVFDETKVLAGKVGEYVVIARKKGSTWYIGAMTNWTEREIDIELSFLGDGSYNAEIFSDGINANVNANDYQKETKPVSANNKLHIKLAQGGGWTAVISQKFR